MAFNGQRLNPSEQPWDTTNYSHPSDPNLNEVHRAMDYDYSGQPVLRTELSGIDHTSSNRLKVSHKQVTFFNSCLFGIASDVWDFSATLGATYTHDGNKAACVLKTSTTTNSEVIRQSLKVMSYIPGRPIEFSLAFQTQQATGARTRVGVFDENNGVYFEKDQNNEFWCVLRSSGTGSVVENRVSRANWNGDKLDGTGMSKIVVPPGKMQMVRFDYEWYGAGSVMINFIIDNHKHTVHTFHTGNRESISWSATPHLPIRQEIKNISATTESFLTLYSTSMSMESASTSLGIPKITGIPLPGVNLPLAFTYYPTVSIRLKAGQLNAVAFLEEIQAFTTDNSFLTFRLIRNATLSNAQPLVWTDYDTNGSSIEVNTNATAFTGGEVVARGIVPLSGVPYHLNDNTGVFQIGRTGLGTVSDTYTLALSPAKNQVTALGTLRWREQR